jgi:arginine utilization regulatory protein
VGKKDVDIYYLELENFQRYAVSKNPEPLLDQYMTYTTIAGKKVDIVYNSYPFFQNGNLSAVISIGRDKPSINELLTMVVNSFNNKKSNRITNGTLYTLEDIIGNSAAIQKTLKQARRVAQNQSTVMLVGETGTGKELFAQGIHNASPYKSRPFIAVNCAAIPETLMESLMMGTVKGAFSGALDTPGFFEQAENGTLFLDEINSLSISLQAKLLRLLQDKTIRRLGDNKERKISCRIISATNQDLFILAKSGLFREDLLYRLTPVILDIPPLRERAEDIPLLAKEFVSRFNDSLTMNIRLIAQDLMQLFSCYRWPGNIRELEHVIESAMSMAESTETILSNEHLPRLLKKRLMSDPATTGSSDIEAISNKPLTELVRQYEKQTIESALILNNGNVSQCAIQLGITRQNLHYHLRRLGISSVFYKAQSISDTPSSPLP